MPENATKLVRQNSALGDSLESIDENAVASSLDDTAPADKSTVASDGAQSTPASGATPANSGGDSSLETSASGAAKNGDASETATKLVKQNSREKLAKAGRKIVVANQLKQSAERSAKRPGRPLALLLPHFKKEFGT